MILKFLLPVLIPLAQAAPPQVLPPKVELTAEQKAAQEAAEAEATLDIEWEKVEGATSYEVRLTPQDGQEPLRFESKETKLTQKLPVGVYNLSIRSKDKVSGFFGRWSAETEVEVVPKIVELISPQDGEEIEEPKEKRSQVLFEWSPVTGAKEYILRIWFDDEKNTREFKSRQAKKLLSLPVARSYTWQVTFLTDQSVGYMASPQIGSFKVLGRQLLKPVISPKLSLFVNDQSREIQIAKWKPSPGAQTYSVKLFQRALDEIEWSLISNIISQKESDLSFEKLKPGAYKLEVIAKANNRVSSETAIFEFVVKPTEAELKQAMKQAL